MNNKLVLGHGYGCIHKLIITLSLLLILSATVFGQDKEQTIKERSDALNNKIKSEFSKIKSDTTGVELKLIKKYESEIDKLKDVFNSIYIEIATGDPIASQRINQLIDGNTKAVSILTSIRLYTKLIEDIKAMQTNKKEEEK